MAPKENFLVVYLTDEIADCDCKVITVPNCYVKDKKVTYLPYPHNQDDKELINTFLSSKIIPPPPPSWVTFSCLVLGSFATLTGANNRTKKLLSDSNYLKASLGKALAENAVTVPNKKSIDNKCSTKQAELEATANKQLELELNSLEEVKGLSDAIVISEETLLEITRPNSSSSPIQTQDGDLETPVKNISFVDVENITHDTIANDRSVPLNSSETTANNNQEENFILVNKKELKELIGKVNNLTAKLESLEENIKIKNIQALLLRVETELQKFNSNAKNDKLCYANIMTKLQELTTFVLEERPLKQLDNVMTLEKLKVTHELAIPFEELADFDAFEQKLSENLNAASHDLKNHFVSTICSKTEIEESVTEILKKFFKRVVITKYVAQKENIPGKKPFKKTHFYGCMKEAFYSIFELKFKETTLLQALGNVITNAKDWQGGRKEREKKYQESKLTANGASAD